MPQRDEVLAYAVAVLAGKVPACLLVRQACARHRRDWELTQRPRGHPAGFTFDLAAVERAVRFFACLHHSKGEWAGQPFTLEPWQVFIVGSLLGWKRPNGTRRFRTGNLEVPRKMASRPCLPALASMGW
jgi:phage terminase large subunit-like protein